METLRADLAGWSLVADDASSFLSLGLCTPEWLEEALPALLAAERACPLAGGAFLHLDVRSDNLCFRAGRALLVDWNWASVGNPVMDVAVWLPSLRAEGGPRPREILRDEPEAAAFASGFFAARAGLPKVERAPRVREVQLAQLRSALPWVVEELDLKPLRSAPVLSNSRAKSSRSPDQPRPGAVEERPRLDAHRDHRRQQRPRIPQDRYFMMGDNRTHSCDTRDWGTVPRENLIGPVFLTYWPLGSR